jgi:hypothetical protein
MRYDTAIIGAGTTDSTVAKILSEKTGLNKNKRNVNISLCAEPITKKEKINEIFYNEKTWTNAYKIPWNIRL